MTKIPSDLKFTKTHEWVSCVDDEITIGITEHAQELLGDLVFVELPEVGSSVCVDDEIGVVESVKAASDFYAPITGVVTDVNHKVCEDPALVNHSPYEDGWLVKIKADSPDALADLLDSEQYEEEIKEDA